MAQNNAIRSISYDEANALVRVGVQQGPTAAGAAGLPSGTGGVSKFVAWTNMVLWGVSFLTVAAGTSTATVNGTAVSPCYQASLVYITNTNTTGTAITMNTQTVANFATIAGTALNTQAQPNIFSNGPPNIANGASGLYAVNTLGGTNTSMVWGTNTFTAAGVPSQAAGIGGLPLGIGDQVYVQNGTDTTATFIAVLHVSIAPVTGAVSA
jgi:hypothetical protein